MLALVFVSYSTLPSNPDNFPVDFSQTHYMESVSGEQDISGFRWVEDPEHEALHTKKVPQQEHQNMHK